MILTTQWSRNYKEHIPNCDLKGSRLLFLIEKSPAVQNTLSTSADGNRANQWIAGLLVNPVFSKLSQSDS